ncbi:hypothetical protein [Methanosarcina mazei]|nr:hypothetical protein [Methanosarcina mazei]
MNLKMLNILLCVILANILGNCALGSSSQNGEDILENETLNFGFDSHASRIGVNEVPLVFFRGNVSELTELSDAADLNETENNTNQQTKSGSETSKEKPNNVPGFSFMYGLFGLYLVCRIRY